MSPSSAIEEELFRQEKLRLHGGVLRASAVEYPPFYTPGNPETGTPDRGIEVELVRSVAEAMGGTVDIRPPTDGGIWGSDKVQQ